MYRVMFVDLTFTDTKQKTYTFTDIQVLARTKEEAVSEALTWYEVEYLLKKKYVKLTFWEVRI